VGVENGMIKFLSELQMMKRKKREGLRTEGVERPGSIAEHSFIVAHLARIIAYYEGADIDKCIKMALFHDLGEARIGDGDKINKNYCGRQLEAQMKAIEDGSSRLEEELSREMVELFNEKEERRSLEARVVQDADWLEAALQAKIYLERGYKGFQRWIVSVEKAVTTDTAKEIIRKLKETEGFVSCYLEEKKE